MSCAGGGMADLQWGQKLCILITIITYFWFTCSADKYTNERAKILYYNPKYITNVKAYTARPRRGDIYKTNITATTLHSWANNVTFEAAYKGPSILTPIKMSMPSCDFMKIKWAVDFVRKYTNINPELCPHPAGYYTFINCVIPPKGFPLPIPRGTNFVNITFYLTKTKEIIVTMGSIVNAF